MKENKIIVSLSGGQNIEVDVKYEGISVEFSCGCVHGASRVKDVTVTSGPNPREVAVDGELIPLHVISQVKELLEVPLVVYTPCSEHEDLLKSKPELREKSALFGLMLVELAGSENASVIGSVKVGVGYEDFLRSLELFARIFGFKETGNGGDFDA